MNELVPLVEESPIDNVPITFEPRLDEGFGTGLPEPEDVSRVIPHQELVIPDLRGDEDAVETDHSLFTVQLNFTLLCQELITVVPSNNTTLC